MPYYGEINNAHRPKKYAQIAEHTAKSARTAKILVTGYRL